MHILDFVLLSSSSIEVLRLHRLLYQSDLNLFHFKALVAGEEKQPKSMTQPPVCFKSCDGVLSVMSMLVFAPIIP